MIEDLKLAELAEKDLLTGDAIVKKDAALYGHIKTSLEIVVGSAELTISQLFQLKPGSVVKMLEDANALMLLKMDGKVVATGSLVIVDDNFGFEIVEIVD